MASAFALREMGGRVAEVQEAELQVTDGLPLMRTLVVVQKTKKTPSKYPRGKNLPRTCPLVGE